MYITNDIDDIRDLFRFKYLNDFFVDVSGNRTVEIINASFVVNDSVIFGKVNTDYVRREIDWYNKQSLNVLDIEKPVPEIWNKCSDLDGFINSNYGYLIYNEENYNQYEQVKKTLLDDSTSRQAIMIYTRPSIHTECKKNGRYDFICTNTVQYFIRDNNLITSVSMRSNDAIFGFNNDYQWQKHVTEKLHEELICKYPKLKIGRMYWNVGSLHIYERHFYLIDYYHKTRQTFISKKDYDKWKTNNEN